jgi:hypothetical protein
MPNTVHAAQSESIVERLIRPAILKLLGDTEGLYRCERDLHHHFTVCLNTIQPLLLGTRQRRAFLEHPGKACYGTGRDGNLDYFFPALISLATPIRERAGAAMELNCNYDDCPKITRDVQKLIDPANAYPESAYFAFGAKPHFFESVKHGVERAFEYFAEDRPGFLLPLGLHIFVVASPRSGYMHFLHEAIVQQACIPKDLVWSETAIEKYAIDQPQRQPLVLSMEMNAAVGSDDLYISKTSAEELLTAELAKAQIPLKSITARCMFETTRNSSGNNRCKFGVTPLWGNELRVLSGRVLKSEFMDCVNRLCDSGHAFQKAGRASWGRHRPPLLASTSP